MKLLLSLLLFLSLTVSSMAQMGGKVNPEDVNKLADMAKGMQLDKASVIKMIDLMVQTGKITPEQAKKAKEELKKKDNKELEEIKQQAIFKMKNGMQQIPNMKGSSSSSSSSSSTSSSSSSSSSSSEPSEAVKESNEAAEALDYLNN